MNKNFFQLNHQSFENSMSYFFLSHHDESEKKRCPFSLKIKLVALKYTSTKDAQQFWQTRRATSYANWKKLSALEQCIPFWTFAIVVKVITTIKKCNLFIILFAAWALNKFWRIDRINNCFEIKFSAWINWIFH